MPRKKNPNNNYFHEGIEEAILLYNKSESELERNRLFTLIYPALAKISEVMYNKIKPTYVNEDTASLMMDCTAFLAERLHMIREGKGKAFSYMTVTARNFYIQANMNAYKKINKVVSLDYVNDNWDINDKDDNRVEEMEDSAKLLNAFADYLEENKDKFSSGLARKSLPVINAVIKLIKEIDSIEDFTRRKIMNDLTEIDGLKVDRHYITKVFNKLEIHYIKFKKNWLVTQTKIPFLDRNDLTQEEIDYCIEHYKPNNIKFGAATFAKKFGVEEYTVRKELYKANLTSI